MSPSTPLRDRIWSTATRELQRAHHIVPDTLQIFPKSLLIGRSEMVSDQRKMVFCWHENQCNCANNAPKWYHTSLALCTSKEPPHWTSGIKWFELLQRLSSLQCDLLACPKVTCLNVCVGEHSFLTQYRFFNAGSLRPPCRSLSMSEWYRLCIV